MSSAEALENWLGLESRFRSLESATKHCHLDFQSGIAGDHWHLSGHVSDEAKCELILLITCASALHKKCGLAINQDFKDPVHHWVQLLSSEPSAVKDLMHFEQKNAHGEHLGFGSHARITSVAAVSANTCLRFHLNNPTPTKPSIWSWFHENYLKAIFIGAVVSLIGMMAKKVMDLLF